VYNDSIGGDSVKLIRLCLSFTVLLAGCYSYTPLTKDTPLPPTEGDVSFRLYDGTHILSNQYQRVENGYKVAGRIIDEENKISGDFDGIVCDEQIKEVVAVEFSAGKTGLAVLLGVGVGVAIWYGVFVFGLEGFHH
jgi:hypothetical protein